MAFRSCLSFDALFQDVIRPCAFRVGVKDVVTSPCTNDLNKKIIAPDCSCDQMHIAITYFSFCQWVPDVMIREIPHT
eukprot:15364637-Ditylum_brightwellii.AAC.3